MTMSLTPAAMLALYVAMAVLAAAPSVSVLTVTARSASAGFAQGAATALGVVAGDLVFILLALSGLALLAEAMGNLFFLLRYLGGAYLIVLGVLLWRSAARRHGDAREVSGASSVLLHAKRPFQRAPERSAARRACAGIAGLLQASATRRMAAQGLARREPPKDAGAALRRLAREWPLPSRRAFPQRLWGALKGPFSVQQYTSFLAGLLVTLGDHKAILFYLGFLPAFVDLSALSGLDIGAVMAIAVIAVGGVKLVYAHAAARAGFALGGRLGGILNHVAAGVMIGVGTFLLARA